MHEYENPNIKIEKTFSFVPGSAPNKFDNIDLENLNILSFYDLPINSDGTLNADADGYNSFFEENTNALFQTARAKGTKVLATLTQTYSPDIYELLNNKQSQTELYTQAAQLVRDMDIDGITINIEFTEKTNPALRNQFSDFVMGFTDFMHINVPGSIVAVAVPNDVPADGAYDIKKLAQVSDNTLVIAYNFAVPEVQDSQTIAPVFGISQTEYEKTIAATLAGFQNLVPKQKLVMERAWYGNGNKYHLYSYNQTTHPQTDTTLNTLNAPLSQEAINKLIADVPSKAQVAARRNLPYIISALKGEKILNANVLAYALATIQHETANTFEPIGEYKGRKSARRLGYEGGIDYYGRGFIQLTHLRNYKKMGERIGIGDRLISNPDLASQPDIAAKVLAAYFKDFGIAKLASDGNFISARTLINPDINGEMIAEIAYMYLNAFV